MFEIISVTCSMCGLITSTAILIFHNDKKVIVRSGFVSVLFLLVFIATILSHKIGDTVLRIEEKISCECCNSVDNDDSESSSVCVKK